MVNTIDVEDQNQKILANIKYHESMFKNYGRYQTKNNRQTI